jgi:hypothetical protein
MTLRATRMRTAVRSGIFIDGATSTEIILQEDLQR